MRDPPMCLTHSWSTLLIPYPLGSVALDLHFGGIHATRISTQVMVGSVPTNFQGAVLRISKHFEHANPRVSAQLEAAVPHILLNIQVMHFHGIKKWFCVFPPNYKSLFLILPYRVVWFNTRNAVIFLDTSLAYLNDVDVLCKPDFGKG